MKKINHVTSGSALLLVLTAIALLSLVILGVVQTTQSNVGNYLLFAKRDQARRLAESGIAFAIHPKITPEDPLLEQRINPLESFKVTLISEGGRLNINYILAQNDLPLLTHLFTTWGLPLEEAQSLVDCLADWVDPDSLKHLNGAEIEDYQSQGRSLTPKNQPFQSVDEMANVFGMDQLEKVHPEWRDSFSIWSEGPLDLQEASAELISIAAEVSLPLAETLVQYRTVVDPNNSTQSKKRKFDNVAQAALILGMNDAKFNKVGPRLTVNTQTFRIKSVGIIDHFQHTIETILRRNSEPMIYLYWNES